MANALQDYLRSHRVAYEIIDVEHAETSQRIAHSAQIPPEQLAKTILLRDDNSLLLAIIPVTHCLELNRVNQMLARSLTPVDEQGVSFTFSDCETDTVSVVGEAYGVSAVMDVELSHQQDIYFESGDHQHLVHMRGEEFRKLMRHVPRLQVSRHL